MVDLALDAEEVLGALCRGPDEVGIAVRVAIELAVLDAGHLSQDREGNEGMGRTDDPGLL